LIIQETEGRGLLAVRSKGSEHPVAKTLRLSLRCSFTAHWMPVPLGNCL